MKSRIPSYYYVFRFARSISTYMYNFIAFEQERLLITQGGESRCSRHLICKQISAILDEKSRFLPVFFDLVDAAIKIYSNKRSTVFLIQRYICCAARFANIKVTREWKIEARENSRAGCRVKCTFLQFGYENWRIIEKTKLL